MRKENFIHFHGFQPGHVFHTSWAMLSCKRLTHLYYNTTVVSMHSMWYLFWILNIGSFGHFFIKFLFVSFSLLSIASFVHSFLYIRMFFRPRPNEICILIFLLILGWKYSCNHSWIIVYDIFVPEFIGVSIIAGAGFFRFFGLSFAV